MDKSTSSSTASAAAATVRKTAALCVLCQKRNALKDCVQQACSACCLVDVVCEKHQRLRDQAMFREQILAGNTDVQLMAADKRRRLIPMGMFRETGFVYEGDTVVIWNLRQYLKNPKWRDDALRKSARRTKREGSFGRKSTTTTNSTATVLRNNPKRFHRIMERLYRQSLDESKSSPTTNDQRTSNTIVPEAARQEADATSSLVT